MTEGWSGKKYISSKQEEGWKTKHECWDKKEDCEMVGKVQVSFKNGGFMWPKECFLVMSCSIKVFPFFPNFKNRITKINLPV